MSIPYKLIITLCILCIGVYCGLFSSFIYIVTIVVILLILLLIVAIWRLIAILISNIADGSSCFKPLAVAALLLLTSAVIAYNIRLSNASSQAENTVTWVDNYYIKNGRYPPGLHKRGTKQLPMEYSVLKDSTGYVLKYTVADWTTFTYSSKTGKWVKRSNIAAIS